jgi:hypothetical protein
MIKKDLIVKCCVFLLCFASTAWSQYQYDDQEAPNYSLADQTKNDMMVIAAAGVGGAVLGLSTLSFVDEPGDHFDNVLTGAAVGLIVGVLYVAYRQAYGPAGIFTHNQQFKSSPDLYRSTMISDTKTSFISSPLAFQWTWQFE